MSAPTVLDPSTTQPVITTIATVAGILRDQCLLNFPKIKGAAFDPELSYESGLERIRAVNRYTPNTNMIKTIPALIWNRTVLKPVDGVAQLEVNQSVMTKPNVEGFYNVMDATNGQFDFEFLFITTEMSHVEEFEISYTGRRGMTRVKNINLALPSNISDTPLNYNINWNPILDSVTFSIKDNFYKAIHGSATVVGWFLAWQPAGDDSLGNPETGPNPVEVERQRLITTVYANGWYDANLPTVPSTNTSQSALYSINNDPLDTNPAKISLPIVPPAPVLPARNGFNLSQFQF